MREARATVVSLGGAVMLGVCILMTFIALGVALQPQGSGMQAALFVLLAGAAWLYLIDSSTERLAIKGQTLELTSALGRTRHIPLQNLESLSCRHEGFNLEQGIESIEFQHHGKARERIPLGPCWQHHELDAFLASVILSSQSV